MRNLIEETIKENIKDIKNRFVFPTQMAADLWADRATDTCGISAVAMERFVAWDDFKGNSVKSKQQDKKSIPSVMRTVFATILLEENKKAPFIKKLIGPEFAKEAGGFTNWIASLLPSLSLWKKHLDESGAEHDLEDEDLLEIYNRYCGFLDKNNLFDPAWEVPPFESDGNHYFIFFPEILSDYSEYKEILESTEDITMVNLTEEYLPSIGDQEKLPKADFFADTRSELKNVALKIRQMHEQKGIDWQDMAISVPDMENYGRYIERELELYKIPHVIRFARPLDSTGAGNFFSQVKECVSGNFSFNTMRDLLLNLELPWRDREAINQLIEFGKANNCICSYVYDGKDIDVWEESFKTTISEERAKGFYRSLKNHLVALVNSKKFSEIRDEYFKFRGFAFDMEKCSPSTDRIISRCISELGALIDIEEAYKEYTLPSPYTFFTDQLSQTKYLEQTDDLGVRVLPYKTAACAPFQYHVVIDASQSALSVIYKPLSFLREDKRKIVFKNKEDPNVTQHYVSLYAMNSLSGEIYFTAASKTLTGYAQVCSYLNETEVKKENLFTGFYDNEKNWLLNFGSGGTEKISELTDISKNGFEFWKDCQNLSQEEDSVESGNSSARLKKNQLNKGEKLRVSASGLKKFYGCPRAWFENYVAELDESVNEATLIDQFAQGNLYHKIMELYLSSLKENKLNIQVTVHGLEDEYLELLDKAIEKAVEEETRTPTNSGGNSFLATELIRTTIKNLKDTMISVVTEFSSQFNGWSVLFTEERMVYEEDNYYLEGFADLVLTDGNQEMLIDFKTSKTPDMLYEDGSVSIKSDGTNNQDAEYASNDERNDRINLPDFQMPAYLYLLEKVKNLKVENCAFFSIKSREIVPVIGQAAFDIFSSVRPRTKRDLYTRDGFEPTMKVFHQKVKEYCEKITAMDFSVNDLDQDFDRCNGCTFRAMCRRVFNISRKN